MPLFVRRVDHLLQVHHRAEVLLRLVEVLGPVAVIGAVIMVVTAQAVPGGVGVVHGDGEPEGVDPEVGEIAVFDLLEHARPVAALEGRRGLDARRRHPVVPGVPVAEAVDEDEIEHGVAPVDAPGDRGIVAGPDIAGGAEHLGVEAAKAVIHLVGVAWVGDPGVPVDVELVEHVGAPGQLDGGCPARAALDHRDAGRPGVGGEITADLDAALVTSRVGEEVITALQRVFAHGRATASFTALAAAADHRSCARSAARGEAAVSWVVAASRAARGGHAHQLGRAGAGEGDRGEEGREGEQGEGLGLHEATRGRIRDKGAARGGGS